jgi:thioredoxin-related protein
MFPKKVYGFLTVLLLAGVSLMAAAKLPRPMADSKIGLPSGKALRLIDTRGKYRVVLLVSSQCDHCVKAVQSASKVEREFRAKGVEFYGAAVDLRTTQELTPFLAKAQPSFPFGVMTQYETQQLGDFTDNDRPFVPIILFVDRNNYVKFQFFGQEEFFKDAKEQETRTRNVLNTLLSQK